MLKRMITEDLIIQANYMINLCKEFIHPVLLFILMKRTDQEIKHIWGVFDVATDETYIVIVQNQDMEVIESSKIKYPKETEDMFDSCLEYYVLHLINEGYMLSHMDFVYHTKMWQFIDEFTFDVYRIPIGLYTYLSYCKETGINRDVLEYYAELSDTDDILACFYQTEYKGDEVILYQPIGKYFLLLNTNLNENNSRIYAVVLLDSKHEIIEKKYHSQLESAINDFNNRFYDLKIKEHKGCEVHIKHCIEEHINFLKERNEEVQ